MQESRLWKPLIVMQESRLRELLIVMQEWRHESANRVQLKRSLPRAPPDFHRRRWAHGVTAPTVLSAAETPRREWVGSRSDSEASRWSMGVNSQNWKYLHSHPAAEEIHVVTCEYHSVPFIIGTIHNKCHQASCGLPPPDIRCNFQSPRSTCISIRYQYWYQSASSTEIRPLPTQ